MLRASVLCAALGVAAAVGPSAGHDAQTLSPTGRVGAQRPNKIHSAITLGVAVTIDDDDNEDAHIPGRYSSEGLLMLTQEHPMSHRDINNFVKAFTKTGSASPKSVKEVYQWDEVNKDDHRNSIRLGNLIDLWWYDVNFPNLPRGGLDTKNSSGKLDFMMLGYDDWYREGFEALIMNCELTEHCFGRWLLLQGKKVVNATRDNLPESSMARRNRLRAAGSARLTKAQEMLTNRYGIYQPHTVKDLMMPELHDDLSEAFATYASENDPGLLNETSWAEAVVHYRVGDALDNEPPIHPRSIARALASLSPQPKTIEVLNGGFNFKPSKAETLRYSVSMLKMLADEIFKVLPNAQVSMPTDISLQHTTVDQDWAKLLHAKSMVRSRPARPISRATPPPTTPCLRFESIAPHIRLRALLYFISLFLHFYTHRVPPLLRAHFAPSSGGCRGFVRIFGSDRAQPL